MASPRSAPFCDYFTITTPKDNHDAVLEALQPFFSSIGCSRSSVGYRPLDGGEHSGLFSWRFIGTIVVYSASGSFVSVLRENGILAQFLAEMALFPHNVSSADFTVDEYVDAPPRIRDIYALACAGGVSFTRKAIQPGHVRALMRPCLTPGGSGGDTGTIYIGNRGRHEVHAKVYDKQHQQFTEHGAAIRPTLRHEMTVSKRMGITLKDLCEPLACFYHFYPAELLPPVDAPPWEPHATGYIMPKAPSRLPAQVLRERVENSFDLEDMFGIAEQVGPGGLNYLLRLISERHTAFSKAKGIKSHEGLLSQLLALSA
jgi:hypothetical protein